MHEVLQTDLFQQAMKTEIIELEFKNSIPVSKSFSVSSPRVNIMSEIGHLRGCYPCMLCAKNFLVRQDFVAHLSTCVDELSCKIAELEKNLIAVTAEFSRDGSDDSKRAGEMYRSQLDDLKFRLELYGYKHLIGGWLSPYYAKYFEIHYCAYCNNGFLDLASLRQHKDGCFGNVMKLKSDLHQKIQKIIADLENSPDNALLQAQLKYLRECHAIIAYKLTVYDAIPCTEHRIL